MLDLGNENSQDQTQSQKEEVSITAAATLFTKAPPLTSVGITKPQAKAPFSKEIEQVKLGQTSMDKTPKLTTDTGILGSSLLGKTENQFPSLTGKPPAPPAIPPKQQSNNPFLNPNLSKVPSLPGLGVSPLFQKPFGQPSPGILSTNSTQGTPTINEGVQMNTFQRGFPPPTGNLLQPRKTLSIETTTPGVNQFGLKGINQYGQSTALMSAQESTSPNEVEMGEPSP